MGKVTLYQKQCAGKRRHPSMGKAEAHLRHLAEKDGLEPSALTTYLCRYCKSWHVGHVKRRWWRGM